jgi:multidrug resistance efflux pump
MQWQFPMLLVLMMPLLALGQTTPATNPQNGGGNVIVAMGLVDVEQGVSRLMVEMPGRIRKIEAKENQVYNQGDVLLAVDDTTPKLKHAQAMKAVTLAEKKLAQAKLGVAIAEAETKAQQAVVDAAVSREETYKNRLKDVKNVEQAPKATVREMEDAVRESGFAVKAEREKLKVIDARIAFAKSDETLAQTQVDIQTEQLKEAEKAINDCVLKAPFKGKVLRIRARLGELVGPTMLEPLIEFCPEAPRIIRGEISQEFAAAAKVGQMCKITDDSRTNSNVWTGKVERLGDWFAPRRSILFEPLQLNDQRTVECIIVVDANSEQLRIGQRVRISLEMSRSVAPVVNREEEKK